MATTCVRLVNASLLPIPETVMWLETGWTMYVPGEDRETLAVSACIVMENAAFEKLCPSNVPDPTASME